MSKKKLPKEKSIQEVQNEALDLIMKGAEILGWQIAIPGQGDVVEGVVLGTEKFVIEVIGEDFDVYENYEDKGSGEVH